MLKPNLDKGKALKIEQSCNIVGSFSPTVVSFSVSVDFLIPLKLHGLTRHSDRLTSIIHLVTHFKPYFTVSRIFTTCYLFMSVAPYVFDDNCLVLQSSTKLSMEIWGGKGETEVSEILLIPCSTQTEFTQPNWSVDEKCFSL